MQNRKQRLRKIPNKRKTSIDSIEAKERSKIVHEKTANFVEIFKHEYKLCRGHSKNENKERISEKANRNTIERKINGIYKELYELNLRNLEWDRKKLSEEEKV